MENLKTVQNASPKITQKSSFLSYDDIIFRIFLGTTLAFALFAVYNYFCDTSSISQFVYNLGYQQHLMNTPAYISKLNSVIHILNFLTTGSFWLWFGIISGFSIKNLLQNFKKISI